MARYGDVARQVTQPARGLDGLRILRMGDRDDAVAGFEAGNRRPGGNNLAGRLTT
jgi:hypothetical protein